jgi:hypothetical protein
MRRAFALSGSMNLFSPMVRLIAGIAPPQWERFVKSRVYCARPSFSAQAFNLVASFSFSVS